VIIDEQDRIMFPPPWSFVVRADFRGEADTVGKAVGDSEMAARCSTRSVSRAGRSAEAGPGCRDADAVVDYGNEHRLRRLSRLISMFVACACLSA